MRVDVADRVVQDQIACLYPAMGRKRIECDAEDKLGVELAPTQESCQCD